MNRQLAWILVTLGTLFAGGTTFLGIRLATAVQTLWWEPATAVMQDVRRERLRGEVYDQWIVSYAYSFDGKSYEGNALGYRLFDSGVAFDELKAAYREQRPVRIYVDEKHPERAVLKVGPGITLPLAFAIALGMTGGIIFLGVAAYRSKR